MPDEPVIRTGFFGKLPATGDFVGRGLPRAFTDRWDRWVSAHLVGRLHEARAGVPAALRFVSGPDAFGRAAGVVLPSADSAGRRYPLTVAAMLPASGRGEAAEPPAAWLDRIEALGREAVEERMTPDALEARLRALPPPRAGGDIVPGLAMWTRDERPVAVSPGSPGEALDRLLVLAQPEPEP